MTRVMHKHSPVTDPHRIEEVTDPVEISVNDLVTKGRRRGFLTWEELNDALPDEAVLPDRLEGILLRLEEAGIDMIDEADAKRVTFGEDHTVAKKEFNPNKAETVEEEFPVESPSRRIDDPIRMYLTQMGEIP
ncbi:MAG: RNA polymerase sigma factor region1.1 domain-containing protein, partial [Phycisphaerae bacterium]